MQLSDNEVKVFIYMGLSKEMAAGKCELVNFS